MQEHTSIGAGMLSGSTCALLQAAEEIALSHHERWDGGGYPRSLAGDAIPIAGRLVALAEVYDELTHARPFRPSRSAEEALAEIERQPGRQFDPRAVTAFLRLMSPAGRDALRLPAQTVGAGPA